MNHLSSQKVVMKKGMDAKVDWNPSVASLVANRGAEELESSPAPRPVENQFDSLSPEPERPPGQVQATS
jgi:hypothetical protein